MLCGAGQVSGDSLLVSKLYVLYTKPDSFRTYTIIAENALGTSSHDVTLTQRTSRSHCSYQGLSLSGTENTKWKP